MTHGPPNDLVPEGTRPLVVPLLPVQIRQNRAVIGRGCHQVREVSRREAGLPLHRGQSSAEAHPGEGSSRDLLLKGPW